MESRWHSSALEKFTVYQINMQTIVNSLGLKHYVPQSEMSMQKFKIAVPTDNLNWNIATKTKNRKLSKTNPVQPVRGIGYVWANTWMGLLIPKCTFCRGKLDTTGKVIHPKYYKHLKKGAHQSIWADKKWACFWQISL